MFSQTEQKMRWTSDPSLQFKNQGLTSTKHTPGQVFDFHLFFRARLQVLAKLDLQSELISGRQFWHFFPSNFRRLSLQHMNSQEYLSYFRPQAQTPAAESSHHRPKSSQYQITQEQKLLPHITEEYQFRITNQLLDYKIKNPRRDKLIVQSRSRPQLRHTKSSKKSKKCTIKIDVPNKENNKEQVGEHPSKGESEKEETSTFDNKSHWPKKKKNIIERTFKTFDDINSPCHNYMNQYLIALENNRMGRRLINTRSRVQDILTGTYYTYHIYHGHLINRDKFLKIKRDSVKFSEGNRNFGKMNNGIKSFFHKVVQPSKHNTEHYGTVTENQSEEGLNKTVIMEDKTFRKQYSKQRQLTHHGYETNNPRALQTAGQGHFSFIITKMVLTSNPPIKPDTMLMVQVIRNYQKMNEILNQSYAEKNNFFKYHCKTESGTEKEQDTPTSACFPYEYISTSSDQNFGIKFKIPRQKEIYLRILKNEGINQRELGVVRIDLQSLSQPQENEFPVNVIRQLREIDQILQERIIYESQFQGQLLKLKKGATSTTVKIEYSFYGKKFRKIEQEPLDELQMDFSESDQKKIVDFDF